VNPATVLARSWWLVRLALVTEWRMYVGAARLVARRPDVPDEAVAVRYVGAAAAPPWGFTVVSAIELVVLHLVLPWPTVRLAADVLGIWGLAWCLGLTACHYVYPHLAAPDGLRLRIARRRPALTIPWDAVAGVRVRERSLESGRAVQVHDRVACFPVSSLTTVEVALSRPLRVTVRGVPHEVDEVRLGVDEPRELAALVRARTTVERGAARDPGFTPEVEDTTHLRPSSRCPGGDRATLVNTR
jgi:hypothetical protein